MAAPRTQETLAAPSRSGAGKYLIFSLGQESYGIPILKVREIIRMPTVTPVPRMPDYLKGVINLRGKVIPVVDLRIKFEFPKAELHERTCMIVVSTTAPASQMLALIVDSVDEVLNISPKDLEPPPNLGNRIETEYMLGMAKTKTGVKTILEIDRVGAAEAADAVFNASSGPIDSLQTATPL